MQTIETGTMRNRWVAAGWILMAVASASLSGCKKTITVPPVGCESCYRPLTTPAAPLWNLLRAYSQKGPDAASRYATLLDPTLFAFRYYDPQSPDPTVRKIWGYTTDSTCTAGLLTDPSVSRIDLTFPLADTTGMINSPVTTDPAGTKKITVNGIVLHVQKGDILYQTTGSGDFYVAPSAGLWKIIRWDDNTSPPVASPAFSTASKPTSWGSITRVSTSKPTSWGSIKSLYS